MRFSSLILLFACNTSTSKNSVDTGTINATIDSDGDGFGATEDCNDSDPQVSPQQEEICDGIDNNCDGYIDEDVLSLFYADSDEDGFGNPEIITESCSEPSGFVSTGTDCNDTDEQTYPGATEICDEADNDCDGSIDNGLGLNYYIDSDEDGFGDDDQVIEACDLRVGLSALGGDCNDTDATQNPLATEICDEIDNNCDGNIDEDVTTTFFLDFDADGSGDSLNPTEACALPAGHVVEGGDCDDLEVLINPFATEICDYIDNNCDGSIDDSSSSNASLWYEDGDDDGYGVENVTQIACYQPTGFVAITGDCNDNNEDIAPSLDELCNGEDDNCDGQTDENGAADAPTWYIDTDGDGYGTINTSLLACTQPAGYQALNTDCDDQDNDIFPGSVELCNGEDDNCDGNIDEDTASDAPTWFLDDDEDGYGDSTQSTLSCMQPTGNVSNSLDCDDTLLTVSPDAEEVCDLIDNDCDGEIDEADAIDQSIWYADADGDGFGASAYTTEACEQPPGYVADNLDCNDLSSISNPDAEEICDLDDNNCDGQIDENISTDGLIWYEDADEDGLGNADNSIFACDQPSGYVDNADDCDDLNSSDLDLDGTQDCADEDIDGDGLRNIWDADPEDETIIRAPKSGTGSLGDDTISGSSILENHTLLDGGSSAGNTTISILDSSPFSLEDEILILSQQGGDAGTYETVFVTNISGNQLEIEPPLQNPYDGQSTVLVQHIPHYQNLTITSSGSLSTVSWDGNGGGVLMIRASQSITVEGSINLSGMGYRGGDGVFGNSSDPLQGESYLGLGQSGNTSSNQGGGGAYPRRADNSDSGGGGGFGANGSGGINYSASTVTSGGQSYGGTDLSSWFFGSGGGGGSPDTEGDGVSTSNYAGDGGSGGGLIALFSGSDISISGSILADGEAGDSGISGAGEVGAGGGGSGGMLYLASPILNLNGVLRAEGAGGGTGVGNSGPYGSAKGGTGGMGRVRLDYDSINGSSTTSVGHTQSYEE
jgi:hypothetical protein